MAPAKKVVLAIESSEEQSIQEQVANKMAMVEISTQQAEAAKKVLKETHTELTASIAKLQRENQCLREAHKGMHYDQCNPEMEENKMDEDGREVEQLRQRTLVAHQLRFHVLLKKLLTLRIVLRGIMS